MASPQTASEQLPTEQAQPQLANGTENGNGHVETSQDEGGVSGVEQGMKELEVSREGEVSLHAACAEGRVEEVREILSRGVENLEVLDASSGCTPIVLAIRNNQPEIVRELLQAGAIVPPSGITNDQQMLSILYPPHMYGMPPFMHQQHPHLHQSQQQQQMPEYYPQPPFYPSAPNGNGNGMYMNYPPPSQSQFRGRKESDAAQAARMDGGAQPNLPPADVAKTIPCRNFPNCKYASNCIFFHPRVGGGGGQFYGQPQPGYCYEGGYQGFPQQGMGFPQPGFQQYQQQQPLAPHPEQNGSGSDIPASKEVSEAAPGPESQQFQPGQPQPQPIPAPHHMNGMPQPFIPAFQQQQHHAQMPMSPPDFGGSPISPSMLGNSLPSIPPADQFFAAASPPAAGFMGMMPPMPMMGQAQPALPHNRRQSFNQFAVPVNGAMAGGVPIPGAKANGFGHGKKASFSGGPRPPFAGTRGMGADYNKWKDGMPPACIFFMQNKCRNSDMCKFPHLDAEGNDTRNPEVIKGSIPPNPFVPARGSSRPSRLFDSAFKQQQYFFLQQQRAAMQQKNGQTAQSGQDLSTSHTLEVTTESAEHTSTSATSIDKGASTLPPKPTSSAASSTLAPAEPAALVRSASQPGVQRVHVNGFNSRSQSPAPSNVSFHGGGHPKRNNSRPGFPPVMNGAANGQMNGHGPRAASASADNKAQPAARNNQRVPGADEFPALGGMGGESKQTSPVARGRTAAEVLSAPAPEKPVVKATPEREDSADSAKSADDQSIEMDSDNESDGVVISVKPSTTSSSAPTPPPTGAAPAKLPTMSFARMAGAMSSPAETAPIAVKA